MDMLDGPTKTISCKCGDQFDICFAGDPPQTVFPSSNLACDAAHVFKTEEVHPAVKEWREARSDLMAKVNSIVQNATKRPN